MRFRTKTILGVAAIEMVLLAVLVGSALSILRESNEKELTQRASLGGKLLAAAAKDAVISQDLATLDSLAVEAMTSGQIDFVRILDANGLVLAERGDAGLLSRPFKQETGIDQVNDGVFDWSTPVLGGGIRYGEVRLGVSIAPLNALLASTRRWAAGIAGLEMLLVALFSWLLGSYLALQLVALRKASERIADGDFGYRVPVRGDDELAQTAHAFNSMAQQLGAGNERLRAENLSRLAAQQEAERAAALIREHSEQLNAIFALSPDGFVSFDGAHCVKYVSPAFTRLTGITADEVLGCDERRFSERLVLECITTARFPGIAALRAQRKVGAGDTANGSAGRRRQLIETAGVGGRVLEVGLRESDAETVSQVLYLRDVTHETEVDRLKSEFLSTAAHELRTPMASIYGFAEVLLLQEQDEATRHELLSVIYRQSELMASIINELLDLARIEARRGKDFVIERLDAQALLQEVVASYKTPNARPSPVVAMAAAADAPLWIKADRKKLIQAVSNVLSNAYKYSPDGGAVEIEPVAAAGDGTRPARVGFRISDHGIGMTPEQLSRVCERFYRADASGKIPGTGLGMSIVKEIVELHGGELEIDSKVGAGTTVSLWIPAAVSS